MNLSAVTKNYIFLTPEERFRLILAAGGRGDTAERDRLVKAGGTIGLSCHAHAPFAIAFNELAQLVYLELIEAAQRYREAFDLTFDPRTERPGKERSLTERSLDLALAAGFILRTKTEGWKLFCERLSVPAFAVWRELPGFERLERTLALAEKAAFKPGGFLRWMNDVRPPGSPELTQVPLTVEGIADQLANAYRQTVHFWNG